MIMTTRVDLVDITITEDTEGKVGVEVEEALTRRGVIKATAAGEVTEEAEGQEDQVALKHSLMVLLQFIIRSCYVVYLTVVQELKEQGWKL